MPESIDPSKPPSTILVQRIEQAVSEKRFTQKKLAEQANIDAAQLNRYLKTGGGISASQLATLERALAELTAEPEPIPPALAVEMARKLRDDNLVLFVGAGLSRQCLPVSPRTTGLPSWQGLVEAVASRFESDEVNAAEVTDAAMFFDYVQRLPDGEAKLKSSLRAALDTRDLALSPAHRAIATMPWAEVWTTNYEELLEQVLGALAVDGEKDYELIGQYRREQKSFVLHLHGTVANPHTLGAESYRKWEQNNPKIINHIQSTFLSGHTVLFIGYGLGDPNLTAIFNWLRNVTDNKTRMYAFLHKATEFQLKQQAAVNNLHAVSLDTDAGYVNALTQLRAELLRQSNALPASPQQNKVAAAVTQYLESYERDRAATAMVGRWNDAGVAHLYITDPKYRADDIGVNDVFVEPSVAPWLPEAQLFNPASRRFDYEAADFVDSAENAAKKRSRPAAISDTRARYDTEERQLGKARIVQRQPACDALAQHRLIVLLGEPGSGKSLLLRHEVLARASAWRENNGPLPFYLRLNGWESRATSDEPDAMLLRCLREELLAFTGVTREQVDAWTAPDQPVHWYLDGMDEVRSTTERERVRAGIAVLARMRPQDRFVVSARPSGYTARFDAQWRELALQPLDDAQVKAVLAQWQPIAEKRDAVTLPVEILDADMRNSPALQRLRRNPLLLTLAILFYRYLRRLPKDRWEYYELVDKNLRDQSARLRALKDEKIITSREAWEPVLGRLALWGMRNDRVRFERKQLEDVVSDYHCRALGESPRTAVDEAKLFVSAADDLLGVIVAFAPDEYGFLHLTFQEFHAAKRLLAMNSTDESVERASIMAREWDNPDWAETWNLFLLGALKASREDLINELLQSVLDNGCDGIDEHLPRRQLTVLRWVGLVGKIALGGEVWRSLETWLIAQMPQCLKDSEVVPILAEWSCPTPKVVRLTLRKIVLDPIYGDYVSSRAAEALTSAVTDTEVRDALVKTLRDAKAGHEVRSSAAKALGVAAANAELRSMLTATILDPKADGAARCYAVEALHMAVNFPDVRRTLLMVATEAKFDSDLRAEAAYALSEAVKDLKVLEALVKILHDETADEFLRLRVRAASSLAYAADVREVRDLLLKLVRDGDANGEVRTCASNALYLSTNDPLVQEAFIRILLDRGATDSLRGSVAHGLMEATLGPETVAAFIKILRDDRSDEFAMCTAARALSILAADDEVRGALLIVLLSEKSSRFSAARAASALGSASAKQDVRDALLGTLLNGAADWYLRTCAASALTGAVAQSEVRDALLKTLLDATTHESLRGDAASALGGVVARSEVRDALLKTLLDATTDGRLRANAASALAGAVARSEVRAALLETLLNGTTEDGVRRAAAIALAGAAMQSEVRAALLETLLHATTDDLLRRNVASALTGAARAIRLMRPLAAAA